ncbi:hypothetical protein [Hyphomicrobium sp.]|uniref:hypothetical protein n=1 Tax=Hyphomicrobium sp. TaxID=82 RepID=UPI001DDA4115|nr:hypothetical protein [Hyphomicrobium sp.]MBY0561446.1 hypothetical protein [Hyphomicrobium sp.]
MTDPKHIADKYIERGGYKAGERKDQLSGDILAVIKFIGWHDRDFVMGGYRADEAFKAFCRVLALDPIQMRKIVGSDHG